MGLVRVPFFYNLISDKYSAQAKEKGLSQEEAKAYVNNNNGNFSLLYINKKEALSLLQGAGLQLPSGLMPRDGFIHSIREKASPVKPKFENITESQQFKRWFGDWEKHPNTASKVQLIKEKYDAVNVGKDVVVVFDSNQIKSADPVTYDDNGKVIIYYYFFKTLLKLLILCDIIKK